MTVHLISVGLSLLDALADPRTALKEARDLIPIITQERPRELLADAGILVADKDKANAWLAGALAPPGDPGRNTEHAQTLSAVSEAILPRLWPSRLSAELDTFAGLTERSYPLPGEDIAILVCSDTPDGLLAGTWNAAALTAGDLARVRYVADPANMPQRLRGCVVLVRIPGMDAGREAGFRLAMKNLGILGFNLRQSGELADDEALHFYLSGGYKASIPYLIGLAEGLASLRRKGRVEAYVLHEKARETVQDSKPIRLPLRRLAPGRVKSELKDLSEVASKTAPTSDYLDGYAYEKTSDGWKLTAFGVGLKALFGDPPPSGLGP